MRSARIQAALAAVSGLLFLDACGPIDDGRRPAASASDPSPTVADVQSADPAGSRSAVARAATAMPRFGSVTQSSNGDGSGVTADTASASFDGTRFVLRIDRAGESGLVFDTAVHARGIEDAPSSIEGNSDRHYTLFAESGGSHAVASFYASWNDADPADYLAGGYWKRVRGDLRSPDPAGVEIGAFLDGPELSANAALPGRGIAAYRGWASGHYAYTRADGTVEIGEFHAHATLAADFAVAEVYGCIGCDGRMSLSGVRASPDGRRTDFSDDASRTRILLGAAGFDAAGTFSIRDVAIETDGRIVARGGGSWGGRFSGIPDGDGHPRLIGGTAGAEGTGPDARQGVFVGAYFGTKAGSAP